MSSEGSFSIRVVDEDGDPVNGARISVVYGASAGGLLPGGVETRHTDSDGWAEFDIYTGTWGSLIEEVYVDGELVDSSLTPEDGDTYSFTCE
jgi:hypothetical protein